MKLIIINSCRFMSTSISYLTNNLSEILHEKNVLNGNYFLNLEDLKVIC